VAFSRRGFMCGVIAACVAPLAKKIEGSELFERQDNKVKPDTIGLVTFEKNGVEIQDWQEQMLPHEGTKSLQEMNIDFDKLWEEEVEPHHYHYPDYYEGSGFRPSICGSGTFIPTTSPLEYNYNPAPYAYLDFTMSG